MSVPVAEGALAGDYTTTVTYKADGSLATVDYPAEADLPAETVTYTYTDAGQVSSVAGIDTYLAAAVYHWDGAVQRMTLGSGNNQVRFTRDFAEATRRLTRSQVHTENPNTPETWVEKLTEEYTYDPAGNVLAINETNAGTTVTQQCFSYDHHRRLTEAWATTATVCQATPTQGAVGGPDAYWQSFTYNAVGNRLADTRHSAGGDVTRTYTYPAAGTARPHALTGVTTSGAGPSSTYTYDNAGNLATRTTTGQPNQTLTFDAEGHLDTLTEGTNTHSYLYDADGARLIARTPGSGTTLYLGDTEYRLNEGSTQPEGTRLYAGAVRTPEGLTWMATDPHNTGQLTINAATPDVMRRRLMPFGESRGTPPTSWPGQKGFVGGTTDPTGYTHLGAREYDPSTGRFISVDPIMDQTDPQQMHGYSYANGNPVSLTDPDGYKPLATGSPHEEEKWERETGQKIVKTSNGKYTVKKVPTKKSPGFSNRYGRNGTITTKYKSGKVTINGFALPKGAPDPDDLAARVDKKAKHYIRPQIGDYGVDAVETAQIIYDLCLHAIKCGRKFMNEVFAFYWLGIYPDWPLDIALDMAGPRPGKASPKTGGGRGSRGSSFCGGHHSLTGETPVLMADGSKKRIDQVVEDDKVLATDPSSGVTAVKTVTATIVGTGTKLLVEVQIDTDGDGGPTTGTIAATEGHPFWDPKVARWVNAGELDEDSQVLTTQGRANVTKAISYSAVTTVYNLTVADIHTYYVLAGDLPVLVHNCGVHRWTSRKNLDDHFERHGNEMGISTVSEYNYAARDLMCTCNGRRPGVQIKQQGSTRYFLDPYSGEFGIASEKGIVTYYIPENPVGHFNNQPGVLLP